MARRSFADDAEFRGLLATLKDHTRFGGAIERGVLDLGTISSGDAGTPNSLAGVGVVICVPGAPITFNSQGATNQIFDGTGSNANRVIWIVNRASNVANTITLAIGFSGQNVVIPAGSGALCYCDPYSTAPGWRVLTSGAGKTYVDAQDAATLAAAQAYTNAHTQTTAGRSVAFEPFDTPAVGDFRDVYFKDAMALLGVAFTTEKNGVVTGAITFDIRVCSYANVSGSRPGSGDSICGSNFPAVTGTDVKFKDTTLSGYTVTTIPADTVCRVIVTSVSGTVGGASFFLFGTPTGMGAIANRREIRLSGNLVSTRFDATSKLIVGSEYLDPTNAAWGMGSSSSVKLCLYLETTSALIGAQADFIRESGAGSPVVVATSSVVTSTMRTLVTLDVSAALRPSGTAGDFSVRIWITTANGNDYATCRGAWLELQP